MMRMISTMVCATVCTVATCARGEDLTCLEAAQQSSLYASLQKQAYAALDRRAESFEKLRTTEQIRERQTLLREFFVRQVGGFPKHGPLHGKTVRSLDDDGYRIECVIFESQGNHHVTANLYLPDGCSESSPVPGVVVSSGHSRTAKTADYNQRFGIMMARQGMAALCFDPIGQGERSQILGEDGEPKFSGTTTEHFLIGVGSTLVGRSTARYRIWDAMRAIDYLQSRPEVDAKRIGMTGCSGGGTLTSYVMALDDRIACAAPACYLTTFRRLIETIGPQDAEQNIYGQIAFGMDQSDYVLMRAPKPTLISSNTDDFFDIQGSWDNFRQAKRAYTRLGFPERVDLVEDEGKHGVSPQNLATIAHWMQRWLLGIDQRVEAVELATRPANELICTETGQVLTSIAHEKSVIELNSEFAEELSRRRASTTVSADKIRELISVRPGSDRQSSNHKVVGRVEREAYQIDKLVLHGDNDVPLPALMFQPSSPLDDVYLYLHDDGKRGDTQVGGAVERIVDEGFRVLAIDLRGQGETQADKSDPLLTDWKTYYLAYLLGKPLVGLRVEDVFTAADFVTDYEKQIQDNPRRIHLVAVGRSGVVALHAAALRPERFASVTLRNAPRDWSSVVAQEVPAGQLDSVVHDALEHYELTDLVRMIGSDKVDREE